MNISYNKTFITKTKIDRNIMHTTFALIKVKQSSEDVSLENMECTTIFSSDRNGSCLPTQKNTSSLFKKLVFDYVFRRYLPRSIEII